MFPSVAAREGDEARLQNISRPMGGAEFARDAREALRDDRVWCGGTSQEVSTGTDRHGMIPGRAVEWMGVRVPAFPDIGQRLSAKIRAAFAAASGVQVMSA
jgi:hypothetical protein